MIAAKKYKFILKAVVLLFTTFSISLVACQDEIDSDEKGTTNGELPTGVTTIPGDYTWGNVAIGGGGFTTGFIVHPKTENLIYLRTDVGGAYRWIENEKYWKPITDFVDPDERSLLGIESMAIDPNNPSKVYIAAGTEYWNNGLSCILISDDYGDTYEKIEVTSKMQFHGNGMGRQNGERLMVDPNKSNILFCGTRKNGLWKSIDSGYTWELVNNFPVSTTANGNGICFIQFYPTTESQGEATQTVFAGVSRKNSANLYVSKNGGQSWAELQGAPTNFMPQRSLIKNQKLYITYADAEGPWNPTTGKIFKHNIGTNNWEDITPWDENPYGGISTNKDNTILLASSINKWINQGNNAYGDEFYLSKDDGKTWTRLFQDAGATKADGGIEWIGSSSIHWTGDIKIDPFNQNRAFVISGNGVFTTNNLISGSPEWVFSSKGIEETVPLDMVSIPDGPLVSVIGDYDGFTHYDITAYPEKRHTPSIGTSTSVAYAGQSPNFVVRVGDKQNRAIYLSSDYGKTWEVVSTASYDFIKGRVAISADGECIIWSAGLKVFRTTDKGATWTESSNIPGSPKIIADLVNKNCFYAFDGSSFFVSANQAVSFTKVPTGFHGGSGLIRAVPNHEGHILFPTSTGLFITKNKGTSFEQIKSVLTCKAVGTGKGPVGSDYPSIYIYGTVEKSSELGAYRSDDIGKTWTRVNDDQTQFGGLANGQFIKGDNNVFGRVYMSTAGRGLVYGDKK